MSTAEIIKSIKRCIDNGGYIFVCGNGGSSAETDHMVSEFVTHGISAISLCNASTITAIANDYSYDQVVSIQLDTLAKRGDVLIGISTSGKSKNIIRAHKEARELGMEVIDWPRKGKDTAEIQENQLKLMHKVYKKLM